MFIRTINLPKSQSFFYLAHAERVKAPSLRAVLIPDATAPSRDCLLWASLWTFYYFGIYSSWILQPTGISILLPCRWTARSRFDYRTSRSTSGCCRNQIYRTSLAKTSECPGGLKKNNGTCWFFLFKSGYQRAGLRWYPGLSLENRDAKNFFLSLCGLVVLRSWPLALHSISSLYF